MYETQNDSWLTFPTELFITSIILGVHTLRLDFERMNCAQFRNPIKFVIHPLWHRASNNIGIT